MRVYVIQKNHVHLQKKSIIVNFISYINEKKYHNLFIILYWILDGVFIFAKRKNLFQHLGKNQ